MKIFKFILFILVLNCNNTLAQPYTVQSPDKNLTATIFLNKENRLMYTVSFKQKEIMAASGLGFILLEGSELKNNLKIVNTQKAVINEAYAIVAGKASKAINHCNELTLHAVETKGLARKMNVIFRCYNDGIAFRYSFPQQAAGTAFNVFAELSEFNFSCDNPCWAQHLPNFNMNYEKNFDKVTLSTIYGRPELSDPIMQYLYCFDFPAAFNKNKLVGLPLVTEAPGGPAIAIAEADLTNYAGMYLQNTAGKPQLHSVLSPLVDGNGIRVKIKTPQQTPWRVIMVADNAGKLIESTLLTNLNRPCKIKDVSWIKPGRSVWDFLAGRAVDGVNFTGGMNMETLKYYVDFAAEYHLEYYTIDEGWSPGVNWYKEGPAVNQLQSAEGIDIPALAKYAAAKNVGLFLWARHDNIRDNMETIFSTFQQWGIKGVKIDFMDSDDQEMVNWYEKCIAMAAKYKLLINFHGAYKATGLTRTYPNYITQEGVKGLEWTNTTTTLTATHNVTLAYTRLLVGPMDYTPGGFNNVRPEQYEFMKFEPITTRAQQMAMTVVYESPLLTLADAPHVYRASAESEFFKTVPSSWDETRFVAGITGDYVVVARRKKDDWFVAGINNENSRTLQFALPFLNQQKKYNLTMYQDAADAGSNPKLVSNTTKQINAGEIITVPMAKSGGFVMRLEVIE